MRVQDAQNPLNRLIMITIGQEQSLDGISRIGETIKVRRMNSYGERFSRIALVEATRAPGSNRLYQNTKTPEPLIIIIILEALRHQLLESALEAALDRIHSF